MRKNLLKKRSPQHQLYWGDNTNFTKLLKTSQQFLRSFNSLVGLACLKVEDVPRMFRVVVEDPDFDERLQPFARNYMQFVWVGDENNPPMFSHDLWNVTDR